MNDDVKTHIASREIWYRLLFMVLFAVISWIAKLVLIAVVIFQFLCKLFTGTTDERSTDLGGQLSTYIYQILNYLTFNTEDRPFPFSDWPAGEPATAQAVQPEPEAAHQAASPEETEPETGPSHESPMEQKKSTDEHQ